MKNFRKTLAMGAALFGIVAFNLSSASAQFRPMHSALSGTTLSETGTPPSIECHYNNKPCANKLNSRLLDQLVV